LASSIPLAVNSANFYSYVNLLSSVYRSRPWLPDQDMALASDPNVWEKVQEDPIVRTGIQSRLHKVAGCPRTMQPGGKSMEDERFAEGMEQVWDEIVEREVALHNLAKAVFLGRTYGYIEGTRRPRALFGAPVMDWWMPERIQDVQRQRFRLVPIRGPNKETGIESVIGVAEELSSIDNGSRFVRLTPEQRENFIRVVYDDDESRMGMGRGILACIYFYVFAKGIVMKERLNAIELYTRGMAILKIDLDRAGGTDKTNQNISDAFLNSYMKMRGQYALAVGTGEDVDVKWPQGANAEAAQATDYLDRALLMVITGSVLPTGAGASVGSNERAQVEQESAEDLVQFDRKLLDGALTRGLVGQFIRNNRPQLAQLGLLAARPPKLVATAEQRQDPKAAVDVINIALQAGIALRKDEVYEKIGFTKPKPGEDVIMGGQGMMGGETGNPVLDRAKQRIEENKRLESAMGGGGGGGGGGFEEGGEKQEQGSGKTPKWKTLGWTHPPRNQYESMLVSQGKPEPVMVS
jgi:hypothetical protein